MNGHKSKILSDKNLYSVIILLHYILLYYVYFATLRYHYTYCIYYIIHYCIKKFNFRFYKEWKCTDIMPKILSLFSPGNGNF